jgi:WD40 repeat protein
MADTLRASEQGLKIVDEARGRKRWQKAASIWVDNALTSTASLKRFWARCAIDRNAFIGICQAVGVNWQQVAELEEGDGPPDYTNIDWGEAPDTTGFVGRNEELATLQQWIINDRCRLVAILGSGGMGKSSLSVALVKQIQQNFTLVIWRSLREAPKLDNFLTNLIQRISPERNPENLTAKINVFIEILQTSRYLIVLDNFEAIFQGEQNVGKYLPGYENYGDLLTRIGQSNHQSCLVITSREKPSEVANLEGTNGPVRALSLSGLSTEAQKILDEKGLSGTPEEKQKLINIYDGNPLALQIVSSLITDVFNGEINKFLKKPRVINRGINDLLDQQYQRLQKSPMLERSVMYWLAINRELVSIYELEDDLLRPLSEIWPEELSDLKGRSLIETNSFGFTLQNVIMEYMTERLQNEIPKEIKSGKLDKFNSYALLKANSKDNVREVQKRKIIQPIIDKLTTELGSKDEVITHLKGLIDTIRTQKLRGYAGGNLINLLCILKADLTGDNFSRLTIKQAFLRDVELHQVNLENAELENCVFPEVMGEVWNGVFSADGTILAVGDELGNVHIWDMTTREKLHTLFEHTGEITSLSFRPDHKTLISFSRDKTIRFWDITTGKSKESIPLEAETSDNLTTGTISYNQQILATNRVNDGQVKLWDLNTGKHIKTLSEHTEPVTVVIFSPNREILVTASKDKSIKVWNVENDQPLLMKTMREEYRDVERGGIAFNCDGKILAAGSRTKDYTIKLWDMSDPNNISHINTITDAHENEIRALAFSRDGKILASGSGDKKVKLWDISDIKNIKLIKILEGHSSWMHQVKFSPDGKILISSSGDKTVGVWNVEQPDKAYLIETFRGYSNWIRGLAFSRDGKVLVSGSDDKTLRLWDTETKKLLQTWRGHDERLQMIAFSPDGKTLASSSWDFTVKLWKFSTDTPTGECFKTFSEHTDQLYCVAFTPDGKFLISAGDDHKVKIQNLNSNNHVKTWEPKLDQLFSLAVSPDSKIIAVGGVQPWIKLRNIHTDEDIKTLTGHEREILGLAFSPDGKKLVSSSYDQTVRLWDVEKGDEIQQFEGQLVWTYKVEFSPNGQFLAFGSVDNTLCLYQVNTDTNKYEILHHCSGHTSNILSVAFSPNSEIVASGSSDETIKLWDTKTGKCLTTLEVERPYQGMKINGIKGLKEVEEKTLKALGAE